MSETPAWMMAPAARERVPAVIDTSVANAARRYNYLLGGKNTFAADRASADTIAATFPSVRLAAVENRAFLRRAVRYLVGEAGVGQLLDIGSGIPVAPTVHEIAHGINPAARVVYVDNDAIVGTHTRALLPNPSALSTAQGRRGLTAFCEGDLREPDTFLDAAAEVLDFTAPVGLLLVAVLHFLPDDQHPHRHVTTLIDVLPSGSFVAISHATTDFLDADQAAAARALAASHGPLRLRSRHELGVFLDGLTLIPSGVGSAGQAEPVPVIDWRRDLDERDQGLPGARGWEPPSAAEVSCYGAVAHRP